MKNTQQNNKSYKLQGFKIVKNATKFHNLLLSYGCNTKMEALTDGVNELITFIHNDEFRDEEIEKNIGEALINALKARAENSFELANKKNINVSNYLLIYVNPKNEMVEPVWYFEEALNKEQKQQLIDYVSKYYKADITDTLDDLITNK